MIGTFPCGHGTSFHMVVCRNLSWGSCTITKKLNVSSVSLCPISSCFRHSVQRPPAYDAWIDMYSGDDFEKSVMDYIAMVDRACETASVEEFEAMKKNFFMSCKMEHMFWDQASTILKWPVIGGL